MDFSSCVELMEKIYTAKDETESSQLLRELELGLRANPVLVRERGANTLVHVAVEFLRPDIVRLLLQYGADPNALNEDRDVPFGLLLHEDEFPQSPVIAKALLEGGADPNFDGGQEGSLLYRALSRAFEHLPVILRDHGAKDDLKVAVLRGDLAAAERFLNLHPDPKGLLCSDRYLLHDAVRVNLYWDPNVPPGTDLKMFELFFRFGLTGMAVAALNPTILGDVVLDSNNPDLLRLLIAKGCDVNARNPGSGYTALDLAMSGDRHELVEILRAAGGKTEEELDDLE
jgi:ankyrin repeat protein